MATIDRYKIKIEVDGKEKIIDVQDELDNVTQKVSNFAKVGAAAFGVLAGSAARMADQLVDLAGTAGMSVGKIYQMSIAAQAAGGSFDQVEGMLLRYSSAVAGAVEGNDKLRDSFAQIGISSRDLETLDDEQLFQKVVSGLGAMEDGAEKTALAVELLGKRAATTDLQAYGKALEEAVDPNIEQLFNNAADAIGALETAFENLRLAALQAINPILEVIGDFELGVEDAQKAIKIAGALIAAAFAASTIAAVGRMVSVIAALATTLRTAGASAAFLQALTGPRGLAVVTAATASAILAYDQLGNAIDSAAQEQERLNSAMGATTGGTPATPDTNIRDLELSGREQAALAAARTTEQMIKQNQLAISLRRTILDVADLEQNRAQNIIANSQAYNDFLLTEQEIKGQIAEEEAKGEQSNQVIIAQLNARLGLAQQLLTDTQELNDREYDRLNAIRLQNEALKNQLSFVNQVFTGMEETARIAMITAQAEGMNTQQREHALKLALEGIRAAETLSELELQLIDARDRGLTDQEAGIQRLIDEENNRSKIALENIADEQAAIDQLNNSRVAGVVSAMEQINQQFTPYQMAQDAILSTWNNIGSAIDQIAQGGKVSFGDFARSVIADLGAMIAKAMIFSAIKTVFGGFGIPGLAKGGPAEAGQPYIVGEKGPELFVPKNAGTVIPNNKLGSQSTAAPIQQQPTNVTNNVYNISAVDAKSVAALFYENRRALLGTMNVAQKELPYGAMG